MAVVAAGMAASGFGTVIGFGGGIFMVPLLVIVFQVPMPFAIGACSAALFPSSLISTISNFRQGLVDVPAAVSLEVPTVVGIVVGAYLTKIVPVKILEVIFSTFVLILAYRMYRVRTPQQPSRSFAMRINAVGPAFKRQKSGETYTIGLFAASAFGSMSGVVAGMFGVGGGFLKMPIMLGVFGMPLRVAVATALCGIVSTSLMSTLTHASLNHIRIEYTAPTVIGFLLGATVGKRLARVIFRDINPRKLIAAGLSLAGVAVFINAMLT